MYFFKYLINKDETSLLPLKKKKKKKKKKKIRKKKLNIIAIYIPHTIYNINQPYLTLS